MEKSAMQLTNHALTDAEKRAICEWHYPGEYAVYDLPPYEMMAERKLGFMNPQREKNYHAFYDGDTLVGFVNIKEEEQKVFIGIGVPPEHCGKGYGQQVLKDAYAISQLLYPNKPLYLEVRTWNQRAIDCYLKAGFVIDGEPFEQETLSGKSTFYRMTRG